MRLSTRTQYGLRMLCQLAKEYQKGPMQLGEIGSREGVSEKYLGQIMLILRNSSLVSAQRGSQGGYFLSRPPDRISVLEAFEVLEGEVLGAGDEAGAGSRSTGSAAGPAPQGSEEGHDMARAANEIWIRLRTLITGELARWTLEDLTKLASWRSGYMDFSI